MSVFSLHPILNIDFQHLNRLGAESAGGQSVVLPVEQLDHMFARFGASHASRLYRI
jgi:hypothetical protein